MTTAAPTEPKLDELLALLKRLSPVALAYSGGLDSRFLAFAAQSADVDLHLYHISGPHISTEETEKAKAWAVSHRIDITCLPVNVLAEPAVAENGTERCYHCKKMFVEAIMDASGAALCSGLPCCPAWKDGPGLPDGLTGPPEKRAGAGTEPGPSQTGRRPPTLCDGSNADDFEQFRPGMRALAEYGAWSPLAVCGITKDDIRRIGEKLGLEEPEQKARPCLLTRFAYQIPASEKTLDALGKAERRMDGLMRQEPDGAFGQTLLPDYRLRLFGPMNQPGMVELHLQDVVSQDFAEKLAAEAVNFGFAAPAVRLLKKVSGWHDRHRDQGLAPNKFRA